MQVLHGAKYRAIAADPPWQFAPWSEQHPTLETRDVARSITRHYSVMNNAAIMALPVADIADKDCVLFLWTTDTHLPIALEVMAAWGFKYRTIGFTWAKTHAKSGKFVTGCGWWTRANCEHCLMGTKGRPRRLARDVKRLVVADRREHSRKPDEVYTSIQRLVEGPYCEMFSRCARPGWDQAFSDQPDRFTEQVISIP
jgi:N6-adenosine-specific RNA methylase IME4